MKNAETSISDEKQKNLTSWQMLCREIVPDITAGIVIAYTLFPLESLKKAAQVMKGLRAQRKDLGITRSDLIKRLVTTGQVGDYKVYRGSAVFALNIVPTTTIQLTTNAVLSKTISEEAGSSQFALGFKAALCGIIGATTATVVENTIARQQAMKTSLVPAMNDMLTQSLTRPLKTYPFIATRDALFTLNMFFVSPLAERYAREQWPESKAASVSAGIGAALVGTAVSHPFDTIATNMQATHKNIGYRSTFKMLLNSGGWQALYRGSPQRFALFYLFSHAIPYVKELATENYDKLTEQSPTASRTGPNKRRKNFLYFFPIENSLKNYDAGQKKRSQDKSHKEEKSDDKEKRNAI